MMRQMMQRVCAQSVMFLCFASGTGTWAQEGASNLNQLPFQLGDVRLVDSDEDGYLYWVSHLSGQFGDFSILADQALFRLDRGTWDRLVLKMRSQKKNDIVGELPLLLRQRQLKREAEQDTEGENFFRAWRQSWAGIFQDLTASRVLIVRHSTGEMLQADSLHVGFARSSLRATGTQLRLAGIVEGKSVFLRIFAESFERSPDGAVAFVDTKLTASESPTPGYDLRCARLVARPLRDGSFDLEVEGAKFAIDGTSILPLPGFSTNTNNLYIGPIQSVQARSSNKFGAQLEVQIGGSFGGVQDSIHQFLGVDGKGTSRWFVPIDVSVKRGPAIDPTFEYELPNVYQGRFTTGLRYDPGTDVGSIRGGPSDPERWRLRTQNRFFLTEDLRMDLEVSLRGDDAFLSEFYEREWKEDKEQETDLYFRYARGAWGGEFTTRPATNDFDTTVQLLPEVRGHLIYLPLFDLPFSSGSPGAGDQPLRVYLTAGAALGQRKIQQGSLGPPIGYDDESAVRGTGEARLSMPFWLDPISFTPYVQADYLSASNSALGNGTQDRTSLEGGLGISTELAAPWGNHWAHRVIPEVRVASRRRVGGRENGFLPLGAEEFQSDQDRMSFALRNTWQENPRRRDPAMLPLPVIDLDLDIDYFPNKSARPANEDWSLLHSEFTVDLSAMVGVPRLEVYTEVDFDVFGLSTERKRVPDAQYGLRFQPQGDVVATLEYREIYSREGLPTNPDELRTIGTSFLYEASTKFDIELRYQYDLVRGNSADTNLILRRKGADFMLELSFGYDRSQSNTTIGFSISPLLLYKRSTDNYASRTLPQGIGTL